VKDFQVAFGMDANGDGIIETPWASSLPAAGVDAAGIIREQLKEVRVYILLHEGQRDTGYRSSQRLNLGDKSVASNANFETISTGGASNAGALSSFTPTGDDSAYRWKVIKLAVKPTNF
jgi:hypothetical protein